MANRILRDWTTSEKIDSISEGAELFFVRLIMKADDYGCFHGNKKILKAALFPLRDYSENQISIWVKELESAKIIITYTNEGREYLKINDFGQRLRTMVSKFPPPDDNPRTIDSNPRTIDSNPRPETKRREEEREEERAIETFGINSSKTFIVDSKYISDRKCRVNFDGFRAYSERHLSGLWFKKPFYEELFWKDWDGKFFNDHKHVNSVMMKIMKESNG